MNFSSRILQWYHIHKRDLPWRNTSDPYKIWLSEIILQQTRIAQGLDYYHKFVERYKNIHHLARASEDDVLALWQGLGYYSRARNLHATAKYVSETLEGKFPPTVKELKKLKGIGDYTAAAIASMAFGVARATIDGNVSRILARYFFIEEPVNESKIIKKLQEIGDELIDPHHPGMFNQGMMDLGATVCTPRKPSCESCPLSADCLSRINGKQEMLPVKTNKVIVRDRFFHYFFIYKLENGVTHFLIQKREGRDIWKNLHQLPLIEAQDMDSGDKLFANNSLMIEILRCNGKLTMEGSPQEYLHILTHQKIKATFYKIPLKEQCTINFVESYKWVTFDQFASMAKPVLISKYLGSIA